MKSYIYVDNSNLFIEGQRVSAVKQNQARDIKDATDRGILDFSWNVNYRNLYDVVCGDSRHVAAACLWGSPPPSDAFWHYVESQGWLVDVIPKARSGREKKVDVAIAYRITSDALTKVDPRSSEITLVAGDGDFVPVVGGLVSQGYRVSVVFWSHASQELKTAASFFFSLDSLVDVVGRRSTERRPAAWIAP